MNPDEGRMSLEKLNPGEGAVRKVWVGNLGLTCVHPQAGGGAGRTREWNRKRDGETENESRREKLRQWTVRKRSKGRTGAGSKFLITMRQIFHSLLYINIFSPLSQNIWWKNIKWHCFNVFKILYVNTDYGIHAHMCMQTLVTSYT